MGVSLTVHWRIDSWSRWVEVPGPFVRPRILRIRRAGDEARPPVSVFRETGMSVNASVVVATAESKTGVTGFSTAS